MRVHVVACALVLGLCAAASAQPATYKAHGIAMHGDLKYGPDFTHFDYVNPDAPKGGEMRRYGLGTFDSFNPFIIKGNPDNESGRIYDTLLTSSADEPFSEYGLLAETIETPGTKGQPAYRAYYASVASVEKVGDRAVKFTFKPGENRELPLIVGQLPVLPKHYWEGRDFEASTLDPPLGSGPYKIDQFEAGRWSTYKRVPDYWGKDLAVNR